MKIVFVSDAIYPYNKGGKEKRIYDITTRLAQSGHEVHLFCMKWWRGETVKKENNVILHGICPLKPLYVKGRRSIWQAIYFSLKIFFPLLKEKFDVLEADHMPYFPLFSCRIVCWLKHKKLFATWHEVVGDKDYWINYVHSKPKGYLGYLIEKLSIKMPDVFISVSQMTSQRLEKIFKVNKNKIFYVPNGIKIPESLDSEDKEYDLVFAGRLLSHKKVDCFLEVVKNLPKAKALIIGSGPEEENLKAKIKSLNLQDRVELNGFLEEPEFIKKIKRSKIFLSCSIREGFGIAVLEALSYGLPAVVVDHPNNASIFLIQDNQNGLVINLNPLKISEKIKNILNNSELFKKMQQEAIKTSRDFNWSEIIKKLETIYEQRK